MVLGHLLLEDALQKNKPGCDGQAYNISQNDPVSQFDFHYSVQKVMRDTFAQPLSELHYVFLLMTALWIAAYISEWNQQLFQGRLSLGKNLDMLTPPALMTASMNYSYTSDKAKRDLGYEPVYTLDEGIQKSIVDFWADRFCSDGYTLKID